MSGELGVQVRVELPAAQFRALEQLAEEHGTSVRSLVRECVRRQLVGEAKAVDPKLVSIREMHGEGLSDSEIGRRLGLAHSTVSKHRRRMGLEANFPSWSRQAVAA